MWSPVRWVALLLKLRIPLRTLQVRMLDSGEADTWRYEAGHWVPNENAFAEKNERRPLEQGVFRRPNPLNGGPQIPVMLYINTNKTAEIAKSGRNKGYALPWICNAPLHQDVFYWLEKLRNWQEKYNPISRRTGWHELDSRHIDIKSEIQLASYPDACFLFRLPENKPGERHLPLTSDGLDYCWYSLLESLELRLAERGETHVNGAKIRLLPTFDGRKSDGKTTLFPLHSLRVSLVTALSLEGQVPFPILQKLVGHSRTMMTIYRAAV
jgi:Putative phage integrase